MSNRTFVCLDCRTSHRAAAVYGKPHNLRCASCKLGLTELPWERRIPKKHDDRGWKDLRVYTEHCPAPASATCNFQPSTFHPMLTTLPTLKARSSEKPQSGGH